MIRETEVDGVPTLLAPASGPMRAGLVFRVGQADETLANRGITHLVEHLALHRKGLTDYHYNGITGQTTTMFHLQGSPEDVVAFLTGVCGELGNLPFDRMETEKALLRTEAAGRTRSASDGMGLWRFGARGYGLGSYPELGLPALSAQDVSEWVRTWFNRENAALWIAGDDIPAGLRLPLPAGGTRRSVPSVTSALPVTPAYYHGSANGVVFDTVVRRGPAAVIYAQVLDRELFRTLRQEGGYSYTAGAGYDVLGGDLAIVTAMADALASQQGAVLGGFVDALMKLKVGRIDPADIEATLTGAQEALRNPESEAASLPTAATDLLTGYPRRTIAEYLDQLRAVTVADVHEVAQAAMASALLQVPEGHSADWAGFDMAPTGSASVVSGRRFPSKEEDGTTLVLGSEGVSVVLGTSAATVRFDGCSVMLAWPDGGRRLIGHDGIAMRIEPTLFEVDPAALAAVDLAVDPAVVVRMPARDPADIPRPEPGPALPPGLPSLEGLSGLEGTKHPPARAGLGTQLGAGALLVLLTVVCGVFSLCTWGVADDPKSDGTDAVLVSVAWVFFLGLCVPFALLVRRIVRFSRRSR